MPIRLRAGAWAEKPHQISMNCQHVLPRHDE